MVKQTDHQIIYRDEKGREYRENKSGSYWSWHDTKEEARERMISDCNNEISKLNKSIERQKNKISKIQSL